MNHTHLCRFCLNLRLIRPNLAIHVVMSLRQTARAQDVLICEKIP